jgi:mRNA interferase YafQ
MYAMKKSKVKDILVRNNQTYKYSVEVTNSFKKDFVDCYHKGLDVGLLIKAVEILAVEGKLPQEYKPHILHNKYQSYMECHIRPDWLLIWKQDDEQLILLLTNTGTHAHIFG